jgi:ribosomal-protein-alanine N-acetyltransferase
MFIIRNAKKADIDSILPIEKASYPQPWDKTAFECELSKQASGMNVFLVAEEEGTGRVAGYFVGNVITDYIHVLNIAVDEAYKRRGVALSFMKHAEREAFKRGLGSMTLEVRENNDAAVALYKKLGYEVKPPRPKFYENKTDGLLMWKKL